MSGIDECPVRGCGAHVPGVDWNELFEGSDYECDRGHQLFVVVVGKPWKDAAGNRYDGRARMEPQRYPGGKVMPRIVRDPR